MLISPPESIAQDGNFFDHAWSSSSASSSSSSSPSKEQASAAESSFPMDSPLKASPVTSSQSSSEPDEDADVSSLINTRIEVVKGALPTGKQYWDFVDWYIHHSVLSLIVSGENSEELAQALENLQTLKSRGVHIGDIIIIGGDRNSEIEIGGQAGGMSTTAPLPNGTHESTDIRPTRVGTIGHDLGLQMSSVIDAQSILKRFDAQYSPLWIVRFHGKDFVFEGNVDPKRLFTSSGQFIGGDE